MCDTITGECYQSGCGTGAMGISWERDGCREGNVAFNKSVKQTGIEQNNEALYGPQNGVDGLFDADVTKGQCAVMESIAGEISRYFIDLESQHAIKRVTLYSSSAPKSGMEGMAVLLNDAPYDSVNNSIGLFGRMSVIGPAQSANITFHQQVRPHEFTSRKLANTGRYMRIQNYELGQNKEHLALCEVVVIGYETVDCSGCSQGSPCDDYGGCTECPPKQKASRLQEMSPWLVW